MDGKGAKLMFCSNCLVPSSSAPLTSSGVRSSGSVLLMPSRCSRPNMTGANVRLPCLSAGHRRLRQERLTTCANCHTGGHVIGATQLPVPAPPKAPGTARGNCAARGNLQEFAGVCSAACPPQSPFLPPTLWTCCPFLLHALWTCRAFLPPTHCGPVTPT